MKKAVSQRDRLGSDNCHSPLPSTHLPLGQQEEASKHVEYLGGGLVDRGDDGPVLLLGESLDGLQEGEGAEAVKPGRWFLHGGREEKMAA